jgi:hypothetical protein
MRSSRSFEKNGCAGQKRNPVLLQIGCGFGLVPLEFEFLAVHFLLVIMYTNVDTNQAQGERYWGLQLIRPSRVRVHRRRQVTEAT